MGTPGAQRGLFLEEHAREWAAFPAGADWGIRSPPKAVLLTQPNGEFPELVGDSPRTPKYPEYSP